MTEPAPFSQEVMKQIIYVLKQALIVFSINIFLAYLKLTGINYYLSYRCVLKWQLAV